jgi:phosphoenolpyruvate-protein kinase (PTS system EI component)
VASPPDPTEEYDMAHRAQKHGQLNREIPIETIVSGIEACSGILYGLKENFDVDEVGHLAASLRRLRTHGKAIILRCRDTFPYMIPVLSEVEGIVSPDTTVTTKGHSAEFCREEGKTLVVADERMWRELKNYEGENILVDPKGRKIILDPDRQTAQMTSTGYDQPESEIKVIGELIKQGRHISLLSTVPEHIKLNGNFSYFCRQEQLVMSKGRSPWDLLRSSKPQCERILHAVWGAYVRNVQPGILVVCRSHDARSDEYPGSPILHEPNPQLGNHGPSLFETFPHLLEAEVAAIAKLKAENPNKKIAYLLPFVRSKNEIISAREALSSALAKLSLSENAVELTVMYETPLCPYLIGELKTAKVKTIWIGTKDLLMSFLMVDRDNVNLSQDYLNLLDSRGELNFAFLEYLNENIVKFINNGLGVIMYALASEVPIFVKYLPKQVGFLLSKGSVKEALKQAEIQEILSA